MQKILGFIQRRGGHVRTRRSLTLLTGGGAEDTAGFTIEYLGKNQAQLMWHSGSLNRKYYTLGQQLLLSRFNVPEPMRPEIVRAVQAATGWTVSF